MDERIQLVQSEAGRKVLGLIDRLPGLEPYLPSSIGDPESLPWLKVNLYPQHLDTTEITNLDAYWLATLQGKLVAAFQFAQYTNSLQWHLHFGWIHSPNGKRRPCSASYSSPDPGNGLGLLEAVYIGRGPGEEARYNKIGRLKKQLLPAEDVIARNPDAHCTGLIIVRKKNGLFSGLKLEKTSLPNDLAASIRTYQGAHEIGLECGSPFFETNFFFVLPDSLRVEPG